MWPNSSLPAEILFIMNQTLCIYKKETAIIERNKKGVTGTEEHEVKAL